MRSRSIFALLSLVVLWVPSGLVQAAEIDWSNVHQPGKQLRPGMLVPDRLIVFFEPGGTPQVERGKESGLRTGEAQLDQFVERFGVHRFERVFAEVTAEHLKAAQPSELARVYVVEFDATRHRLKEVADGLLALPNVSRVEPDAYAFPDAVPNDPMLVSQNWLRNLAVDGKDIRGVAAWYHSTGDTNVTVAVIDTGVDWQHPDLGGTAANGYRDGVIWNNWSEINGTPGVDDDGNGFVDDTRGWDLVNVNPAGTWQDPPQDVQTADNDPMDYGGHGTPVAGCISTITNNGVGVASTSWNCAIMPIRMSWDTIDEGAPRSTTSFLYVAQSFDYARVSGADVINISWSFAGPTAVIEAAINAAIAADIVVVTSAGNDDTDIPRIPGSMADVLAIAAVDVNDVRASFSNFGSWVDLSAPGVGVFTTGFSRQASGGAEHTYGAVDGTSFASPIVAGACAIVRSVHPSLTESEVRAAVMAAVDDIEGLNPGYLGELGTGRLNLSKLFDDPKWLVPDQFSELIDAYNTAEPGDEIAFRASHVLTDRIVMPTKPLLFHGGYDDTYTVRDPVNNKTLIDTTGKSGSSIAATGAVTGGTVFDGFEITGGQAAIHAFEPIDGRYGGGIVVKAGAAPIFRNLRIQGNVAGNSSQHGGGGGIAVLNASPLLEDVEITANQGSQGSGIYVYRGSPTFRRVDIHDNVSHAADSGLFPKGGGAYVIDTGGAMKTGMGIAKRIDAVTLEDCVISGHSVEGPGGGIYAENSSLILSLSTVQANTATGHGGGVHVFGGSYTGLGNQVLDNQIVPGGFKSGGGLYVSGATAASIDQGTYIGNSCDLNGGGISIQGVANPAVTATLVAENSAGITGSGVSMSGQTAASFSQNTVANNFGAVQGSNGLFLSGDATVSNNIFAFNGGGGTTLADGVACTSGSMTFSCNVVYDNLAGNYSGCPDPTGSNGNVEADPRFCDVGNQDYGLAANSPAAELFSGGCGLIGARDVECGPVAVDEPTVSPRRFAVRQNYPNPFNPRTTIFFVLPTAEPTKVTVFDQRGRLVRTLLDQHLDAGEHSYTWDGRDEGGRTVASGTYFYRVAAGQHVVTKKMGLLR